MPRSTGSWKRSWRWTRSSRRWPPTTRVVLRSPRNSATGGAHRGNSRCSTGCAMLCNGHWLPMGTRCGSMFRTETPGIPTSPAGSPSARQTSGSSSERWSGDESPSPYSPRVAPVRRSILLFATVAMLIAVAAPVLAGVNVVEVADEVSLDGLYVEPGLSADTSSLNASITRAGNSGVRLMVVLLDADPSGGAVTFADAVLDRVSDGTVLVLSGGSEGIASTEFDQSTLDAALDRGFLASSQAPSGSGDEAFVSAVVDFLTGSTSGTTPGTEVPASSGGGSSGLVIMLVIVGGMVLLVWVAVRKTKKSAGGGGGGGEADGGGEDGDSGAAGRHGQHDPRDHRSGERLERQPG